VAKAGYVRNEDGAFEALIFRDEATGDVLEVQRSLVFDAWDVAHGTDTYCLVWSSGPTYFGGVTRWAVSGRTVVLELTAAAAETLGQDRRTVIDIESGVDLVRQHLGRLVDLPPSSEC
jgi:Immunity protein 10